MSVEFQVAVEGAEEFARKMEKLDLGTQEYIQQALVQTAEEIVLRAQQLAPIKTGWLMQNIYARVISKYAVKVGCYVPYALFQEFRRHFLILALQESAPKLFSIMSLALQRAEAEASL